MAEKIDGNLTWKLCDLCGKASEVMSKCIQCNQIMCSMCKTIHERCSATSKHTVQTETMKTQQQSHTDGNHCQIHPNSVYQLFCKTCDILVCLDCVTGDHQSHHFVQISHSETKCDHKIFQILEEFEEKNNATLQETLNSLLLGRKYFHDKAGDVKGEITSRATELHSDVDKVEQKLIDEVHKITEDKNKMTLSNISTINEQIHRLNDFIRSWKEKLLSSPDNLFLKLVSDCKVEISKYLIHFPNIPSFVIPRFMSSTNDEECLESVYGQVIYSGDSNTTCSISKQEEQFEQQPCEKEQDDITPISSTNSATTIKTETSSNIKVKVISAFKSPYDGPTLSAIDEKTALIGSDQDTFAIIGQNGYVIKSVNPPFRVRHATVLPSGDFLIACGMKAKIVKLNKDGKIEIFYNTKPFNPYRLCVTDNGHILVCLTAYMDDSQVVRLSMTGEKLQTFSYSNDDCPLFEDPGFLLENINGDIWVQDQGYVMVIQTNPTSYFKYSGPPGVKMNNPFRPAGLAHDKLGRVIIADNANSTIHLLNIEGGFMQYLLNKQDKLFSPYALSIDSNGNLWIGCEKEADKNVMVIKYLE